MADNEAAPAPAPEASEPSPKGKLPLKMIIMILGLMLAEGAGVFVVLNMMSAPQEVKAEGITETPADGLEQIHEVLIVDDRFPNHQTGRVWLWEVEVQVQVRQKNLDYVQRLLEERSAEVKTGIAQIIRTSHHKHLTEPNLDTINRQIEQYLRDVFEYDAEGNPRIERVLLPKCVGFPADF